MTKYLNQTQMTLLQLQDYNRIRYYQLTSPLMIMNFIWRVAVMEHFGHYFIPCQTEQFLMKNIGWPTGIFFIKYVWIEFNIFEPYYVCIWKSSILYPNDRKVNEKFAEVTINALKKTLDENPDQLPIIWIHDYHLMLAANTIRQVRLKMN